MRNAYPTHTSANTANLNSNSDSVSLEGLELVLLEFEVEVVLGVRDGVTYL
jgi:hypothetical protein